MNKLVLLGNGFDLAHNLKTSYLDFLIWYFRKVLAASILHKNYNDALIAINFHRVQYSPDNFDSISELLKTLQSNGTDIKYYCPFFQKIVTEVRNQNWVDIEAQYYSSLVSLYRAYETAHQRVKVKIEKQLISLNDCFETIEKELIEYLTIIENNQPEKLNVIHDHFQRLIRSPDFKKKEDVLLVVNFNYTSTVELYISPSDYSKIIDIHGKINCNNNPIIFGYGDEMDIHYNKIERLNNNEFLRKFKSFGYLKTTNYQEVSRFIRHKDYGVTIMGHSCGISDRVLLNSIFDNPLCKEIRILYHQWTENNNDYIQKTMEISRQFKGDSKDRMRNIITSFTECERLS